MTLAKRLYILLHVLVVNFWSDFGFDMIRDIISFVGDDQKLAEYLIQKGAHVNTSNKDGETPLHYAARSGTLNALR